MAKRNRADSLDADVGQPSKKLKAPGVLSQLSECADDLIECLQALRTPRDEDRSVVQRLSKLSKRLLPTFEALSKAHDEQVAGEEVPDSSAPPTQETPAKIQPELPVLTPWSPSGVAEIIPPLPAVLDPTLERASLTHAGMVKNASDRSYEQLEWLGDAYLYLMSTAYIFMSFPHLPHGDMCHIREVLVRNSTLKQYSVHYGIGKQAIFPEEFELDGRKGGSKASGKERTKALGDLFEARVAAIILSDPARGVSRAAGWLKELWSTTISEEIRRHTYPRAPQTSLVAPSTSAVPPVLRQPQAEKAKTQLSGLLCLYNPRVNIEYRTMNGGKQKKDPLTGQPLFTQGAYLVGYGEERKLGEGSAKNKSKANEKAAQQALANKKLVDLYKEKKRLAMENKKAQEQLSEGLGF